MEKEKTVPEMIQEIADKICNDYCKYPDQVRSQVKDIDDAENTLIATYCDGCPLQRLT